MPQSGKSSTNDVQDEIVRLLVIQLKQQMKSQTELILELSKVGFGPTRIAELVGTTLGTAKATINQAKKKGRSKKS